jgi:hypothetical protein
MMEGKKLELHTFRKNFASHKYLILKDFFSKKFRFAKKKFAVLEKMITFAPVFRGAHSSVG